MAGKRGTKWQGKVVPLRAAARRPRRSWRWTVYGVDMRSAGPILLLCFGAAGYATSQGAGLSTGAPDYALTGLAHVIDGDTIDLKGMRVRLDGIDAPEMDQGCERDGRMEACGRQAGSFLTALIGNDEVTCAIHGEDRYGRLLGICHRFDTNLNRSMVWAGQAVAYTRYSWRYLPAEVSTRWEGRGIWATDFENPEAWRHGG
jgi:endonuclease YncB( thermonuclease family)